MFYILCVRIQGQARREHVKGCMSCARADGDHYSDHGAQASRFRNAVIRALVVHLTKRKEMSGAKQNCPSFFCSLTRVTARMSSCSAAQGSRIPAIGLLSGTPVRAGSTSAAPTNTPSRKLLTQPKPQLVVLDLSGELFALYSRASAS